MRGLFGEEKKKYEGVGGGRCIKERREGRGFLAFIFEEKERDSLNILNMVYIHSSD